LPPARFFIAFYEHYCQQRVFFSSRFMSIIATRAFFIAFYEHYCHLCVFSSRLMNIVATCAFFSLRFMSIIATRAFFHRVL
jgi:hypothetical protein